MQDAVCLQLGYEVSKTVFWDSWGHIVTYNNRGSFKNKARQLRADKCLTLWWEFNKLLYMVYAK